LITNAPVSPYVELARVVALANLELPSCEEAGLIAQRAAETSPLAGICAYEPFVDELARALREARAIALSGMQGLRGVPQIDPRRVYRPAYGIESLEDFRAVRSALVEILHGVISGDPRGLRRHCLRLNLSLVPRLDAPSEERRIPGQGRRRQTNPRDIDLQYLQQAETALDCFVYGMVMATEAKLLGRLSHCRACNRFILGKSDRVVSSCARTECREALASATAVDSDVSGAATQQRRRQRQMKWQTFVRTQLRPATDSLNGAIDPASRAEAAEHLREVVTCGRGMLPQCFLRRGGSRRIGANKALDAAEALIGTKDVDACEP